MGGGGKGSVDTKDIIRNVKPKLLIDGEWRDAKSGKTFATINPEDETVIMEVAEADAADIDLAVAAARKAFDEGPWPRTSGPERARILNKFADLLEANLDELAALETLDNGKPYAVAKAADLPMSIKHFRYFAGHAATGLTGETIPLDNNMGNMFGYTLIEPIGVVGAVIPWNFPALMLTWKVAPALAAGCTVVVKVAEQTPLTALRYGELFLEAGGPPGVLNILPGYGPTAGARLTSHPDVDKIAFTGSTEVGRIIGGVAGKNLKPVTLELGGKSACIVWKDVDIEKAVEDAHQALFFNMGQCCTAGSRTFVHEDIYEEFVEKAAARAAKRNTGNPWLPDTEAGPQIDKEQFEKILDLIQSGKDQGATLKTGGKRKGDKGFFIEPTVFSDVHDDMEIAKTEIFGPCQSILKYKTIEEVVQRANASNYGLAAGVFAKDVAVVNRLSRALKAGTVWTNCWNQFDAAMPFGGYKDSGVGRDKGHAALHNYTQTKAVYQPLEGDPTWL